MNRAEAKKLQITPPEFKMRQLAALLASADAFGWTTANDAEVEEVRRRWQQLRKAYGV